MTAICPLAALKACPEMDFAQLNCRHSEPHTHDSRCNGYCPLAEIAGMEAHCIPLEVDLCPDK